MADTTLAPAVLLFRRRLAGDSLALDPALEIGVGGEARVLGVPGDDSLVAKLYHDPTMGRAAKLARMIEAPPALAGAALAWPVDLLTAPGGRFAGFLMPRAEGPRLFELYNPVSRRRVAPLFDWGKMHRAGASLAAAFDALHGHGYVVGDVNESNILVSPAGASVTLVDADSFQVRDPVSGAVYRSGVGKAEFTPPELQGARFAEIDRAPEHDRFGLAALLFLLLMEGTHPFAQRIEGDAEALPVEERILRGLYPHAHAFDDCKPPRLAPPIQTLHPGLQALFLRCFAGGHADPRARPSAAEWKDALLLAESELRPCADNPQHRFGGHIPFCPWCHRARLLQGRDPFPVSLELARAADSAPVAGRHRPPSDNLPQTWARPSAPAATAPAGQAPAVAVLPPAVPGSSLGVFLGGLQAGLPLWLAGPTALGHPLPWAGPAVLTVLMGATGGVRVMAMAVGFMVLRRVFRGGMARVTSLTAMWIVAMMLFWAVANGIASGSFARGDTDFEVTPPKTVVDAGPSESVIERVDVPPAPSNVIPVYELAEVDVQPELANRGEVEQALATNYPTLLRDAGVVGTVTVTLTVDVEGRVDPGSISVESSTHEAFADAARRVVEVMRFHPGERSGIAVPVRVTLPVTFTLR